jgi:hypothetical protein
MRPAAFFVAIRASSSKHIGALVADLASDRAATREAAIVRLTVLGARAAEPLAALAGNAGAPPAARSAALRVFEATAEPRGLDAALLAIDDGDAGVAAAGVAAASPHLRGRRGAAVVDRLTTAALDRRRPNEVRAAAVQVLSGLEQSTVRPLMRALREDPVPEIAALASAPRTKESRPEDPAQMLADAVAGRLPEDPDALRRVMAQGAHGLALTGTLALVERIREREDTAPAAERMQWRAARGAAHLALARRGSRLGLYDIREALERAKEPLPVEFLASLAAVGDASCLEAIAAAYAASTRRRDDWWRTHLAEAFHAIVSREKLTRRHAAVRRLEQRSPEAMTELWAGRAGGAGKAGRAGR